MMNEDGKNMGTILHDQSKGNGARLTHLQAHSGSAQRSDLWEVWLVWAQHSRLLFQSNQKELKEVKKYG